MFCSPKLNDLNSKDFWAGRLKENFGLHGTGFQGLGRRYNEYMYKVRRRVFLQRIRRLNIEYANVNVLDIGSGTGFYVGLWKYLVISITGTDIATVAVENLKSIYPTNEFLQVDIGDEVAYQTLPKKFDTDLLVFKCRRVISKWTLRYLIIMLNINIGC